MSRRFYILALFLIVSGPLALSYSRQPTAAVVPTEAPRLGELVLPYIGEATVEFSVDEEWGIFSFSVPKPASVTEMDCDEIGWEFEMDPKNFPIQLPAEKESVAIIGLTHADVIDGRVVITVVTETEIHKFAIPVSPALEYGADRFALGANSGLVRTVHVAVANNAEQRQDCAGGSCSCGAGRCSACCSVGYHPSCSNCGRNGESCKCFKNRGSGTVLIEMEYEVTALPDGVSSP